MDLSLAGGSRVEGQGATLLPRCSSRTRLVARPATCRTIGAPLRKAVVDRASPASTTRARSAAAARLEQTLINEELGKATGLWAVVWHPPCR